MSRVVRFFRTVFRRRRFESDMAEELGFHLDMESRKLAAQGLDAETARRQAVQRFGGVDRFADECRDATGATFWDALRQDVRVALRGLRRNPGYAAAALATLALGIGANVAVFSVVHGVFLQSLPYGGGDRLVHLRQGAPGLGFDDIGFSALELADYGAQSRKLAGFAEYHSMWFILLRDPEPERVQTGVVSANFFDLVGVKPILGRTFRPGEDAHGAEPLLVLSYEYWMRSHGGDPGIIGRTFKMNDRVHTVIGVLPPMPGYPDANDVYMPTSACPFRDGEAARTHRDHRMSSVYARLAPGATARAATGELTTIAKRLVREFPEAYAGSEGRITVTAVPVRDELTDRARPTFLVLFATVGLVLLLACANVANLTVARQLRRQRELALRAALGAGRGRLARQMLTESTVLALGGGLLGVGLAAGALGLLVSFAARFTPRATEIRIDLPVLLFALGVSVATGLVFGILPSLSRRVDLARDLSDGGDRASGGARRHRLRDALIVVQVAVSFMLLIGAGLMLKSLWRLASVDPGFRTERVLTARLDLNFSRYMDRDARRAFHNRLLDDVAAQPGVVSAAIAGTVPLNDGGQQSGTFLLEGRSAAREDLRPVADFQQVSPRYFATIGVPLRRGRLFTEADRDGAPLVAVVNETMSRHLFPASDPIGHRLSTDEGKTWVEIVGVVGDVRQWGLDRRPPDQVYFSTRQFPPLSSTVLVRTTEEPMALSRRLRAAVHRIDGEQAIDRFRTLEQVRANALASPRLTSALLGLFAALALAITSAGIAGVVAYSVGERRQEFGIRLALGADPRQVMGMVLRQALGMAAVGLAVGFVGSHLLAGAMSRLLFEVNATDPPTFLAMAAILAAVAAGASFLPARRVTRVDPMIALRAS